jgi:putative transposase
MYLFDRQIISYTVGTSPNLELTNNALREALASLEDGQKPLVHSDQGFPYQHLSWRILLEGAGAVQSMSRKVNCYDNAVMENFFGHLKEELFHRVRFLSTDALATQLKEYIRWYNTERISTKAQGPEPGAIPCPGPRGLGSYLASPTSGDQFSWEGSVILCAWEA